MRSFFLSSAILVCLFRCGAQTPAPVIAATGFFLPIPLTVAPGGLLTLYVEAAAGSNVTAVYSAGSDQPMPVVRTASVSLHCFGTAATCAQILSVTVQIPFGIPTYCALCERPSQPEGSIALIVNGVKTPYTGVVPFPDEIHFLTACDTVTNGSGGWPPLDGGLPCTPMVTHSDGSPVSSTHPAQAGEELIAYATGLGETNPSLTAGQPAPQSAATVTAFAIDFNFRVNALATQPGVVGVASPLFAGATQGYAGLYQINFVVPAPPAGLPPCVIATLAPGGVGVQSNLTVSVGSHTSFDGAGICVQPLP